MLTIPKNTDALYPALKVFSELHITQQAAKVALWFALVSQAALFGTGLRQLAVSSRNGPKILWGVAVIKNAYVLGVVIFYMVKVQTTKITRKKTSVACLASTEHFGIFGLCRRSVVVC